LAEQESIQLELEKVDKEGLESARRDRIPRARQGPAASDVWDKLTAQPAVQESVFSSLLQLIPAHSNQLHPRLASKGYLGWGWLE